MSNQTFVKGFRTKAAYYPESTFGTFAVTDVKAQRVGGKVRGVNWNARQNILQTGNVGDGRNYKQQILGQYDASASMTIEVCDFSFLRFGVGDVGKWDNDGTEEVKPWFLVESELSGITSTVGNRTALRGTNVSSYAGVRTRPFSLLLYDMENVSGGSTFNDSVDMLNGCMISDFNISSSIGTPLMCNVNMVVREVAYRRFLPAGSVPDFTSTTAFSDDYGLGCATMTPKGSQYVSDNVPLMFYNGGVYVDGKLLGQVQSFNYSWNNSLLTYREIGSRFIVLPQTGMRRQTLSMNVVFRLPAGDGSPSTDTTTILELIKNYLGYASTATFNTGTTLRPALATNSQATSPQISKPIEKTEIKLKFTGNDNSGAERGATINVYNAAIEGFGVPVTLESGLIEIPITCSVRGFPYNRIGDGSYNGYDPTGTLDTTSPGVANSRYKPTFMWWQTIVN